MPWADDNDDSDEEEQQHQQQVVHATSAGGRGGSGLGGKDGLVIPPTHRSRIDSKGIQTVTSYRQNTSGQLIKTVTRVKVSIEKVREAKTVEIRRKWKKFGQAAMDEKEGTKTTVQSKDDVFLEDPNADTDLQDEDPSQAISANLNAFWAKQQRRQLERKYDVTGEGGGGPDGSGGLGGDEGGGWTQVGPGGASGGGGPGGGTGKYVPPSMRAAAAAGASGGGPGAYKPPGRSDDLNTIRVTNLSSNTTESDLQELFQGYGRISRVYLAKDKETMQSRGFAFVSFVNKDDAARAMEGLQGFGYDHLILKLEWARPNAPKDPASSGTEFRSGYGKALAQDTKEKVSFASNLTK